MFKHRLNNINAIDTLLFRRKLANAIVGGGLGASAGLLANKAIGTDSPWLSGAIGGLVGAGGSVLATNTDALRKDITDAVDLQKARHEGMLDMASPYMTTSISSTPSFNAWLHPSLGAAALGGTIGALAGDKTIPGAMYGAALGGTMGMALNRAMLYGAKFPHLYTKDADPQP